MSGNEGDQSLTLDNADVQRVISRLCDLTGASHETALDFVSLVLREEIAGTPEELADWAQRFITASNTVSPPEALAFYQNVDLRRLPIYIAHFNASAHSQNQNFDKEERHEITSRFVEHLRATRRSLVSNGIADAYFVRDHSMSDEYLIAYPWPLPLGIQTERGITPIVWDDFFPLATAVEDAFGFDINEGKVEDSISLEFNQGDSVDLTTPGWEEYLRGFRERPFLGPEATQYFLSRMGSAAVGSLSSLRESVLRATIEVLEIELAARTQEKWRSFWGDCVAALSRHFSPDEVAECIRLDRVFSRRDVRDKPISGRLPKRIIKECGGLSHLLELVGEIEGRLRKSSEPDYLMQALRGHLVNGIISPRTTYYDLIPRGQYVYWNRAYDRLMSRERIEACAKEADAFRMRVIRMLATEFLFSDGLTVTLVRRNDEFVGERKDDGEGNEEIASENPRNRLTREGRHWLVLFESRYRKKIPHMLGMIYLATLLECEGEGFDAERLIQLAGEKEAEKRRVPKNPGDAVRKAIDRALSTIGDKDLAAHLQQAVRPLSSPFRYRPDVPSHWEVGW